jgi:hypothetical protein
MQSQFLSDGSDYRSRSGGGSLAKGRRDEGLFWWTILITLLLAMATLSWFFSIMVFKYPEKPFHYNLLMKLKRLDPLTEFDPLAGGKQKLPNGTFFGARELLAKYYSYNPEQLRVANDVLKRTYITNYKDESPVYVKGAFKVTHTRPLIESDIMSKGWVMRAKSMDLEDVELELILPGAESEASPHEIGDIFSLDNKSTFASVINVQRDSSTDGLCATVVPIAYGKYTVGEVSLALSPPLQLNMAASWPVTAQDLAEKPDVKVAAQAVAP